MTAKPAALSRVIGDIYDAAIDPRLWPTAMESSCAFIGGSEAGMFWHDVASEAANAMYLFNDDPSFTRLYLEKYIALNPIFPAAMFSDVSDVGRVHAPTDIVPKDELEATRFFKEWVAPQGITDTLAVALEKEALRGAYYVLHWHGGTVDDAARGRMALLVPHLQRAVAIGRLFVRHAATEKALTETLDHIDSAVFLVAGHGRVVFTNRAARDLVGKGVLLQIRNDRLVATDPIPGRALKDGLRDIEKRDMTDRSLGSTVVLSDAPHHRWTAHILPLAGSASRLASGSSDAIAAIFVRDAQFSIPTPLELVAKRYKLTASEARVVDAVVRASGGKQISEMLGITGSTLKTHLSHIYRKCGAKNQSDLIKLVTGIGGKT